VLLNASSLIKKYSRKPLPLQDRILSRFSKLFQKPSVGSALTLTLYWVYHRGTGRVCICRVDL